MRRLPWTLVLLVAGCSSVSSGRSAGPVGDPEPPRDDAGHAGRTWNPTHALDCDAWCARASAKCPAQFAPDAGATCVAQCGQELAAAGACSGEIGAFLWCAMTDAGFRCDLPSAQQTACTDELAGFRDCAERAADGGAPDGAPGPAYVPRPPR